MSFTESTKNVKGNRKVVRAEYHEPASVFEIPDGLDLEDKDIVEEWYVCRNILHIKYVGKEEEEEIEPTWDAYDCDLGSAKCEIEDADDVGFDYECDEEEEEVDKYKLWKSQSVEITCRLCGDIGHKHDWNDDDDDMEYGTCGACEEEEE